MPAHFFDKGINMDGLTLISFAVIGAGVLCFSGYGSC